MNSTAAATATEPDTLFFDDSEYNIQQFAPFQNKVRAVLVEPTVFFQVTEGNSSFDDYVQSQVREGNEYARTLGKRNTFRRFEAGSGMSIDQLESEIESMPSLRTLILDWDLTLSVCNGLHLPPVMNVQSAAVFYAGGLERFKALQRIFADLRKRSVSIIVLTDNGNADYKNRDDRGQFVLLMQQFDPAFQKGNLLYGNGQKGLVYQKVFVDPLLSGGSRSSHKTFRMRLSATPRTLRRMHREEKTKLRSRIDALVRENKRLKKQLHEAQMAPLKELERRLSAF